MCSKDRDGEMAGVARKVCKFGGSSLAQQSNVLRVNDILQTDPLRSHVVVSAPGKRFHNDEKITDALLELHNQASEGTSTRKTFEDAFEQNVANRYFQIMDGIASERTVRDVSNALELAAAKIYDTGTAAPDFAISRGEQINAVLIAGLLGHDYLDSAHLILFDSETRTLNYKATIDRMRNIFQSSLTSSFVIPGFYGSAADSGGEDVITFSRGGSDVTGALVAAALSSSTDVVYENWTDVDGLYSADPSVCPNAKHMPRLGYDHLRAMAMSGANVFHPDAIDPVESTGVPTHVRNTFAPDEEGTWIVATEGLMGRENHYPTAMCVACVEDNISVVCSDALPLTRDVICAHMEAGLVSAGISFQPGMLEPRHPLIVSLGLSGRRTDESLRNAEAVQAIFATKLFSGD